VEKCGAGCLRVDVFPLTWHRGESLAQGKGLLFFDGPSVSYLIGVHHKYRIHMMRSIERVLRVVPRYYLLLRLVGESSLQAMSDSPNWKGETSEIIISYHLHNISCVYLVRHLISLQTSLAQHVPRDCGRVYPSAYFTCKFSLRRDSTPPSSLHLHSDRVNPSANVLESQGCQRFVTNMEIQRSI
jgi:hypothetical protein